MTLPVRQLLTMAAAVAALVFAPSSVAAQDAVAVVNPSFEEPGSETTDWTQVPGWTFEATPANSGVGNNPDLATDGEWIAWLQSDDGPVYQLTDYVVQGGDVITLDLDARSSWQTTTFDVSLYYDDGGARQVVATTTTDFMGIVDDTLLPISVTFDVADAPAAVGNRLGIQVENTSEPGSFVEWDNVRLTAGGATAAEPAAEPAAFTLDGAAPNPFSARTEIAYTLRQAGTVRLDVFDVLGRRVASLVDGPQAAGPQVATWSGRDAGGAVMPAGVYVYRLTATAGGAMVSASRAVTIVR